MDPRIAQGLPQAAAQSRHMVIYDNNHRDPSVSQSISSPDLMRSIARAGYRDVAVEMNPRDQRHISDLNRGRISIDQFVDRMAQNNTIPDTGQFTPEERERQTRAALERKGNLIVEAGRNGISVHAFDSNSDSVSFPDPERFVLNHPVTREIEQDFARERGLHTLAEQFEFGRRNPEEVTNYFQERFNRQPELRERIGNDYTQALRDFQRARTADDQTMGTAILQQTQGRRTAVIVGGAHDALGQALGPDTLEIGIYTNQEARQQALEVGRVLMEREHREPREPHVTTFVEEGRSYFTRQPSPSIERAYGFSSMGSTEPITVARNDPSLNQAIEEARRAIPSPNMQSHSAHDDPNHGTQGGRAPSQQRHH